MPNLFEARNLVKTYILGDTKINALDGISMDIKKGEFIAIIGKSGSGKSTLMHMIGLLDTPTSGSITLNSVKTSKLEDGDLAKIRNKDIGFVFQSFNLLTRTSALDNVLLPLKYSDVPKKLWQARAAEMLDLVELSDRKDNKSNELSGGQKQRVAIARALVNDPAIVLADEPTGNLDSKTGDDIVALFKKLHKSGKTIVIVTHDDDISQIADRRIFLKDGKVLSS